MENELARSLSAAGSEVQLDTQVKRVLAQKQVLAWIMKFTVREFMQFPLDVIQECIEGTPEISSVKVGPGETNEMISGLSNEDKIVGEGAVYYDIRFFAIVPGDTKQIRVIINVEMQRSYYPGYPIVTRGIYYGARMISAQLGREFSGSDYSNIRHVYSIWLCTGVPASIGNAISEYRMEKHDIIPGFPDNAEDYDKLSVVVIGLNENLSSGNQLLNMLNVLLSTDMSLASKKQRLQDDFSMVMERSLEKEVSAMCNYSGYVMEKGIERGIERGIKKGISQGEERLSKLLLKLNADGETELALVVLQDAKAREECYKKYGID